MLGRNDRNGRRRVGGRATPPLPAHHTSDEKHCQQRQFPPECNVGSTVTVRHRDWQRRFASIECAVPERAAVAGFVLRLPFPRRGPTRRVERQVNMPIRVSCSCGKTLQVSDEYAGRRGKCPACGSDLQVPAQPAVVEQVASRKAFAVRSRRKWLLISGSIALLAVVAVLWLLFRPTEPTFRDRTASSWIGQLADHDQATVLEARRAIASIGPAAVPYLAKAVNNSDRTIRWGAIQTLGDIGPSARSATGALHRASTSGDELTRRFAILALGKIKQKESVPVLIGLLDDPDVHVREVAATVLGEFGDDAAEAIPPLLKMIEHEKGQARAAAFNGLAGIGEAGWSEVLKLRSHPDADICLTADAAVDMLRIKHARDVAGPVSESTSGTKGEYEVLTENLDGTPIEVAILTSLPLDSETLRKKMVLSANRTLERALQRSGRVPIRIRVFAYTDKERFHSATHLWVGGLWWPDFGRSDSLEPMPEPGLVELANSRDDSGYTTVTYRWKGMKVEIAEHTLWLLSQKPQAIFGKSEGQRQAIYRAWNDALEDAKFEAEEKYPTKGKAVAAAQLRANQRLQEQLEQEKTSDLCRLQRIGKEPSEDARAVQTRLYDWPGKRTVTKDGKPFKSIDFGPPSELDVIINEGQLKKWPE